MSAATHITNRRHTDEELLIDSLRSDFERHGADPSGLFDTLEISVRRRIWEAKGMTFTQLLRTPYPEGVGVEPATLLKLLTLPHQLEGKHPETRDKMTRLRADVRDLLNAPLASHGTNQHLSNRDGGVDNINSTQGGTSTDYAIQRLKRDHPALARRVLAGELSAHKAAVEAGFRRRSITVPLDPVKAARTLARHFSDDEWRALAREVDAISHEGSVA